MSRPLLVGLLLAAGVVVFMAAAYFMAPELEVVSEGTVTHRQELRVDTVPILFDPTIDISPRYSLRTRVAEGDTLADLNAGLGNDSRAKLREFAASGRYTGDLNDLPPSIREEIDTLNKKAARIEVLDGTSFGPFEHDMLESELAGAEDAALDLRTKLRALARDTATAKSDLIATQRELKKKQLTMLRIQRQLSQGQPMRRRAGLTLDEQRRVMYLANQLPSGGAAVLSPVAGFFTPHRSDSLLGYVTRVRSVESTGPLGPGSGYRLKRRGSPRLWAKAERVDGDGAADTATALLTGSSVYVIPVGESPEVEVRHD